MCLHPLGTTGFEHFRNFTVLLRKSPTTPLKLRSNRTSWQCSQGIWLIGDMTNHKVESAILCNKQTRQESYSIVSKLKLEKRCVLTSCCGWNNIPSDVHSCLFYTVTSSKEEEMIFLCGTWTEALQQSVTTHWRAMINKQYLFEFFKWPHLKAKTLFHTKSNLLCLVCWHVVSVLFSPQCIFHCVRTWCVGKVAWLVSRSINN